MKTVITLSAILLVSGFVRAQNLKEADVPTAVKDAFKKQFPNAGDVEWEKEGANYEVEFEVSRVNMDKAKSKKEEIEKSAEYTAAGEWVQTEEEIKVSDLPKGVSEYVEKNMAGKKISEASKCTAANSTITYEAEIGKEHYIFDANGSFVKVETKTDDDDDDKKEKKK